MTAISPPVRRTASATVALSRTGTAISLLAGGFLLFDAVNHMLAPTAVVESFRELGFTDGIALPIGLLELALVVLYAIPRTSVLGATLLTGFLGGAVCAQLRIDAPLFSTMLFPVYVGIALWAGLYLRNARLRAFLAA